MDRSILDGYDCQGFYCEMLRCPGAGPLRERFAGMPLRGSRRRRAELYNLGITFTVYSDGEGDRPHPAVRRDPAHDLRRRLAHIEAA